MMTCADCGAEATFVAVDTRWPSTDGTPLCAACRERRWPEAVAAENARETERRQLVAEVERLRARCEMGGTTDLTDPDNACQGARWWKAEHDRVAGELAALKARQPRFCLSPVQVREGVQDPCKCCRRD